MSSATTPAALATRTTAATVRLAPSRAATDERAVSRTATVKSAMSGLSVAEPIPSAATVGVVSGCVGAAATDGAGSSSAAQAATARVWRMAARYPGLVI